MKDENKEEDSTGDLKKPDWVGSDGKLSPLKGFMDVGRAVKGKSVPHVENVMTEHLKNDIMKGKDIDLWLDELTPCLVDGKTGEHVRTNYRLIKSLTEIEKISREHKWEFDWVLEWNSRQKGSEIYKLSIENDNQTQGIIHIIPEMGFVEAKTLESAPHNRIKIVGEENRKYKGVGGHLVAIAAKRSMEEGNGGYLGLTAVSSEVEWYKNVIGAKIVGRDAKGAARMEVDERAAKELCKTYFGGTK